MHIYIECMSLLHPIGKISASSAKKKRDGALRIQEVTEVSAKLCKSA